MGTASILYLIALFGFSSLLVKYLKLSGGSLFVYYFIILIISLLFAPIVSIFSFITSSIKSVIMLPLSAVGFLIGSGAAGVVAGSATNSSSSNNNEDGNKKKVEGGSKRNLAKPKKKPKSKIN